MDREELLDLVKAAGLSPGQLIEICDITRRTIAHGAVWCFPSGCYQTLSHAIGRSTSLRLDRLAVQTRVAVG